MEPAEISLVDHTTPPAGAAAESLLDGASQPYVGRWNQLVSATNWEKGRIIHEWRTTLIEAGSPAREYADDAWARRVGAVTGQHVGRLRRVHERFGAVQRDYPGLFWSHFHSALDWDDAELWLEGALQSGWSVSQLRRQRWEARGALEAERPRDQQIVTAEMDEDATPAGRPAAEAWDAGKESAPLGPPIPEGADFGEDPAGSPRPRGDGDSLLLDESAAIPALVRPFAALADLPPDVQEAFEAFKLAILRHKATGWTELPRDELLAVLDALKELALAPAAD